MRSSRIFRYISSWWTTAATISLLAAVYIVCLYGDSPWESWTEFMLRRPLGMLIYWGLIINLSAATIRAVLESLGRHLPDPGSMEISSVLPSDKLNELAALMSQEGYSVSSTASSIHAVKAKFSFLPGVITRAGILIFLVSVFAGAYTMSSTEKRVHEGEVIEAFGRQLTVGSLSSDMPAEFLQFEEEGSFRLKSVKAELRSDGNSKTVTSGFPVRIGGIWHRITHFGMTLPVSLKGNGINNNLNIDLDILPPGKSDLIALQADDLFLSVSLNPEKTITKGLVKAKKYNLEALNLHIIFQRGGAKEKIGEINVKEGAEASVSGLSVSAGRHSYYIRVRSVSDPALPFVYAATLLALAGTVMMISRFFWYRKELTAIAEGSALHIGYREEFFRKWASQKFHRWIGELTGGGSI